MKALVYTAPEMLEYRDVAPSTPPEGEIAVAVESVGICGSDMHAYLGHDSRRPAPLVLGHEVAGVITSGGRQGERVTVNPLVTCGVCAPCRAGRDNLCGGRQIISMPPRPGGFTASVSLPEANLVAVPDHLGADQAALAEPIACGWHAVRLAREVVAEPATALVIGGGAIGLGSALSLHAQGVADITLLEPHAARRAYLGACGGHRALDPSDLPAEARFDVVIDAVGIEPTRAQASAQARPGGVIVHIGLGSAAGGLDVRRTTLWEIAFRGSYTYTARDFRDTFRAMADGRLGPLDWTEARELKDGAAAFADIRQARVAAPKIILKPNISGGTDG